MTRRTNLAADCARHTGEFAELLRDLARTPGSVDADLSAIAPPGCMACGRIHPRLCLFSARLRSEAPPTEFRTCAGHAVPSAIAGMRWLMARTGQKEGGT